jgi:hypothetical protein
MPEEHPKMGTLIVWLNNEATVHISVTTRFIDQKFPYCFKFFIGQRMGSLVENSAAH